MEQRQSRKRKSTTDNGYSPKEKKRKIGSLKNHIKTQEALLTQEEVELCSKQLMIDVSAWRDFTKFCTTCAFYDRYKHSQFHAALITSFSRNGLELQRRKKGETCNIKRSMSPRVVNENDWADFYAFKFGMRKYTIYQVLVVEFKFLMATLFTKQKNWMVSNTPELCIPSFILRGCLAFFPERTKTLIPNIKPSFYDMGSCIHSVVDIFKMAEDYGSLESGILAKGSNSDGENGERAEGKEEEEEEERVAEEDEEFIDTLSVMHSNGSNSLSSLSSLKYSIHSIDEAGRLIGTSENEKLFSRYFYMQLPVERVKYTNGVATDAHPYDLALYIFTQAKKMSLTTDTHISVCYKQALAHFKTEDISCQKQVFSYIASLKEHIFGKTADQFNLCHIAMVERITTAAKDIKTMVHIPYTIKERTQESVTLNFSRNDCRVLDVYLALEYLNIKYSRLLNLSVKKAMEWDQKDISVRLDFNQYEALTKTIVFFESIRARRAQSSPLYPVLAQRYLKGSPFEMSHSVNTILKMIRETRSRVKGGVRWASKGTPDEVAYLHLLPKIIKKYTSFDFLWEKLVHPFSNSTGFVMGPTHRWIKTQTSSDVNAERYRIREEMQLIKVNWNLAGFDIESCNLYLGLESFFAIRTNHMIQFWALNKLMKYISATEWVEKEYPHLTESLAKILNGGSVKNIGRYTNFDMVDLPFDVYGAQKYDVDKHEDMDSCGSSSFLHVQIYKVIADPRAPADLAVSIFESLVMKNHRFDDQTRKSISVKGDTKAMEGELNHMKLVRGMATDSLKRDGYFKEDYEINTKADVMSDLPEPDEFDFFAFLLESLERLSFFHTEYKKDSAKFDDSNYRGNQPNMPRPDERWLPFNNQEIKSDTKLWHLPLYYKDSQPVYSDGFIPTLWTMAHKYSGCKDLIRNRLKFDPIHTSLMAADPEFLNCTICYPITSL